LEDVQGSLGPNTYIQFTGFTRQLLEGHQCGNMPQKEAWRKT